jgi:hypothetical protein
MMASNCAVIVGGASTCINASAGSTIVGGVSNKIYASLGSKTCNAIVGGQSNCINNSCNSFIGGGGYNCISSRAYASVIGCSLSATADKTVYMNNATVACHLQVGGTTTMNSTTGRIDASNDVVAFATSDRRLKCNIKPIENALCKVVGASGNTFDWKELTKEETQNIHGNTGKDVGVIAQEIEAILPEAVTTRDSGYKAVNYEKIVPLLIEAIKTLTLKVEDLESKMSRKN